MKISSKALIYSTIVFPGAGYFIVHHTHRAVVSLLITLGCLFSLIYEAFFKAQIIAEKIINGKTLIDINTIRDLIANTPSVLSPGLVEAISMTIVVVWLVAIIDCYRLGKALDKSHIKSAWDLIT